MEHTLIRLSRRYQTALKKHLESKSRARPVSADSLGRQALDMGLETLDLAKIHEQALVDLIRSEHSSQTKERMIKRAQVFFIEALTRIEKTHRSALEANLRLTKTNAKLLKQTEALADKTQKLKAEIAERRVVEKALKQSEKNYRLLLEESHLMQEQLHLLSRQMLLVQEEERKRISRELHDEVAQVMTGINLYLVKLKREAASSNKGLEKSIAHTQNLLENSANIVHQFAGQLRPPALDDLGLFSALQTFINKYSEQTGLDIRFTSFTQSRIDKLDSDRRTVLYRITQESLANVAKHAKAKRVTVNLTKQRGCIRLEIKDNGQSFQPQSLPRSRKKKGLGLLGMHERAEMVGGRLTVTPKPGQGTTIRVEIPLGNGART